MLVIFAVYSRKQQSMNGNARLFVFTQFNFTQVNLHTFYSYNLSNLRLNFDWILICIFEFTVEIFAYKLQKTDSGMLYLSREWKIYNCFNAEKVSVWLLTARKLLIRLGSNAFIRMKTIEFGVWRCSSISCMSNFSKIVSYIR